MQGSKSPKTQNIFTDALQSEIVAGSENLATWIRLIHSQGGIEDLFGLETWLKGIRSFLNVEHLPLAESEKEELLSRSYSSEIKIIHDAVQICEIHACSILNMGQTEVFESDKIIEKQLTKERIHDVHINRLLEQLTPIDSMSYLMDALNDLKISIDAFQHLLNPGYQIFLSLSRSYRRELKNCRYIHMLLSQKFRLQYDVIDNKSLSETLRSIQDEPVRHNLALALLSLFRFLKYLKIVFLDMQQDRSLRHHLIIFSLLHEEMDNLSKFLKARLIKGKKSSQSLKGASELVAYTLKNESSRVISKELIYLSRETEPSNIYTRIETSYNLLLNCCQSSILSLVHAIEINFDAESMFPRRADRLLASERIRQVLWNLRQWMMHLLDNDNVVPDTNKILERLTAFKEKYFQSLAYSDWAEFEGLFGKLAISNNPKELRIQIRKFINFIESLIQEVTKHTNFQEQNKSLK
jgi:hypothetical protein